MPFFKFNKIKITGVASTVPTNIVKSMDYANKFGLETIEKFIKTTGVKEHRMVNKNQTASDLGYVAAEMILNKKILIVAQ